jgi:secreted trypsin-like serine protease
VRLVGFGETDAEVRRGMTTRHFVDVTAHGYGCDTSTLATGCMPPLELVLGRNGGRDTCAGDSGGPVLENAGGSLRIVAVTSRSILGGVLRCGDGGIYTRVDQVDSWIRAVTAQGGNRL